jgi:hypothetical protein
LRSARLLIPAAIELFLMTLRLHQPALETLARMLESSGLSCGIAAPPYSGEKPGGQRLARPGKRHYTFAPSPP